MKTQVVILAAGKGKRMHTEKGKVIQMLAGRPMLAHIVATAMAVAPETSPIIVYGHQGEKLRAAFSQYDLQWVEQTKQLGTAHALLQAMPLIDPNDRVLVLYGDVPLTSQSTLNHLIKMTPDDALGMLTAHLLQPQGYGRIERDTNQKIVKIIEEKDATDTEKAILEVNPGIYLAKARLFKSWLPQISNKNAQQEYYLTDIIGLAVSSQVPIYNIEPKDQEEILGVNDRVQLANLERYYQRQQAELLMRQGITLYDPSRIDVRGELTVGKDTLIDINVIFEGTVKIGKHCVIGPNCVLHNVILDDYVEIKANCVLEDAEIGADCKIGPFARLRPGTILGKGVHIGNFVEIKKSEVADNSKINHLSYIGDSTVGSRVNVGAGTITCNYDGVNKYQTIIEDDVFIGSDTQLVAPVKVGHGASIGAGSTIIKDVPPNNLVLTQRLDQRSVQGWQRQKKKETSSQ